MNLIKKIAATGVLALATAGPSAMAATIIDFASQLSTLNFFGTYNSSIPGNTLTASDVPIMITTLDGASVNYTGYLDLMATSTGTVFTFNGNVFQDYTGSFSICGATNNCSTNYLSTTFAGLLLNGILGGASGGGQISLTIQDPPHDVDFTSNQIDPNHLADPSSFGFALTGVTPALSLTAGGSYLNNFRANLTGNASASQVPEPATLALLGLGLLGFAVSRRRTTGPVARDMTFQLKPG